MIASDTPTTIPLNPALLAQLGPTAALAVSVELPGGSPTGPVIAKGSISAVAQSASGKTIATSSPTLTTRSRQST